MGRQDSAYGNRAWLGWLQLTAAALAALGLVTAIILAGPDTAAAAPGDGGDSNSAKPGCYYQSGTNWIQGTCPAGQKATNAPRCFVGTTPAKETTCPDFMPLLPGTAESSKVPAPNPPCYEAPAVGSEDTPGVLDDWRKHECPSWAWFGTCIQTGLRPIQCPPNITPGPSPDYSQPVCLREGLDGSDTSPAKVWIPAKCIGHPAGTCFRENDVIKTGCPAGVPGTLPGSPTASVGAGDSSFGNGASSSGGGDGGDGSSDTDNLLGGTGGKRIPGQTRPDTQEFRVAVANLQSALLPVVSGLAGIGVLLGAGMIAIGQQGGIKIAATSASVGGVLLLGFGLIQAFPPTA